MPELQHVSFQVIRCYVVTKVYPVTHNGRGERANLRRACKAYECASMDAHLFYLRSRKGEPSQRVIILLVRGRVTSLRHYEIPTESDRLYFISISKLRRY